VGDICLAVIDGTRPYDDASYNKLMQYSFCNQIARQVGADARYERGPSTEGYRVHERGECAAKFLLDGRRRGARRLMLAGYSRGGSAAIMGAEILKKSMRCFCSTLWHGTHPKVERLYPQMWLCCTSPDAGWIRCLWRSTITRSGRSGTRCSTIRCECFLERRLLVTQRLSRRRFRPFQDRTVQSAGWAGST
jgi:hypothetical protein